MQQFFASEISQFSEKIDEFFIKIFSRGSRGWSDCDKRRCQCSPFHSTLSKYKTKPQLEPVDASTVLDSHNNWSLNRFEACALSEDLIRKKWLWMLWFESRREGRELKVCTMSARNQKLEAQVRSALFGRLGLCTFSAIHGNKKKRIGERRSFVVAMNN